MVLARQWFPLDYHFRKAAANLQTSIALDHSNDTSWKELALPELYRALAYDPTSADLLVPAIIFDLTTRHDPHPIYEMFKRVAVKNSPLFNLVPDLDEMR